MGILQPVLRPVLQPVLQPVLRSVFSPAAGGCSPQIDWMSDQPVRFAFTAGTVEQDGFSAIGYSNGQGEIPPIGSIVGSSPSGGLDVVDATAGGNAQAFAAVSGSGQPPLWARPAHVSVSGAAGSIELSAPLYDAGFDRWAMFPPYNPDAQTPPLGLVVGQNYCVTVTFDTPLLQPDFGDGDSIVFGFVAVDNGGGYVGIITGGLFLPPAPYFSGGFFQVVTGAPQGSFGGYIGVPAGFPATAQVTLYSGDGVFIRNAAATKASTYISWSVGTPGATMTPGETYYVKITKP